MLPKLLLFFLCIPFVILHRKDFNVVTFTLGIGMLAFGVHIVIGIIGNIWHG